MIQRLVTATVFVFLTCATLVAQTQYEIHPYGGGFFPGSSNPDYGRFRNEGIFGVKGGVVLPSNIELGGNLGYISHFEIRPGSGFIDQVAPANRSSVRGIVIEMTGDYHVSRPVFGPKVMPYFTGGLGVLTAHVTENPNGDRTLFLSGGIPAIAGTNTGAKVIALNNNDSFFTISYGGGLKAQRLAGPMGVRADIRGRTMPNLFGHAVTWPEITGGLTFVWGER